MRTKLLLIYSFTLVALTAAEAGSVGIVEYGDSLSNREHAAVLKKKASTTIPSICYNVCAHDEDPSTTCKIKSFCMNYKEFETKLGLSFNQDQFVELNQRSQQQQLTIENFRRQIEKNSQTTGSFTPTPTQKKQYDDRLKTALKEADDLVTQIATLKTGTLYLAYRDILQALNDSDENEDPDFYIDRGIHYDNWRRVVSLFWTSRGKEICHLGHDSTYGCVLHLNGTRLANDAGVSKNSCNSTNVKVMASRFKGYLSNKFQTEVSTTCKGHYEIRDYSTTITSAPPENPLDRKPASARDMVTDLPSNPTLPSPIRPSDTAQPKAPPPTKPLGSSPPKKYIDPDDDDSLPFTIPPPSVRPTPTTTRPPATTRPTTTTPPPTTRPTFSVTPKVGTNDPKKEPPKKSGCASDR